MRRSIEFEKHYIVFKKACIMYNKYIDKTYVVGS